MPADASPPKDRVPPRERPADSGAERVIDSGTVLAGRAEVVIRHNGRLYRLRATRLGKLILTA